MVLETTDGILDLMKYQYTDQTVHLNKKLYTGYKILPIPTNGPNYL